MFDHPTPDDLERFVRGALPPAEVRALVGHLIAGGCKRCFDAFASDAPLLREPAGESLEVRVEDYGAALRRAFAAVGRHGTRALEHKTKVIRALAVLRRRGSLMAARGHYSRMERSEAMLRYACELRHEDPRRMLHILIVVAGGNPEKLLAEGYLLEEVADFQAWAQAELANAWRVNDRLLQAERELQKAFASWKVGTRDQLLVARLHDVQASLLGSQYRYREAVEVLEDLSELYLDLGDRHLAGRALISQGIYVGYGGDPARAVALIEEGLERIDSIRDPGLAEIGLHNRIYFLTDQGYYTEAFALLTAHRRRLLASGGRLQKIQLTYSEARIVAGLGHLDLAEGLFREARAGFSEAGAHGHAALLVLELSHLALRQGRTAEARSLAEEAWAAFTVLDIPIEAQRAVALVRDAFAAEIATAALVRSAVDFLRRLEREPAARFRPDLDAT